MKTMCQKCYFVYIRFRSVLKVYMKRNVDVHFYRFLKKKKFKVRYFVPNLTHFENSFHSALQHLFENNVITTDMKSSGIHLLNYQSFRHFKPFSFLDKSTGPILPLVVQALNISIILFIIHFFFDFQCKNVNINITSNGKTFFSSVI